MWLWYRSRKSFSFGIFSYMSRYKFKIGMYSTVNTAFINYLDQFQNLTEYHEFPIIKNKTTFKQTLPISLNVSKFDSTLPNALSNLKDFIHWYTHDTEILICKKDMIAQNYLLTKFFFWKLYHRHFSCHYCDNFFTGYNFDSIFII